jgi:hypothetical protein
VDPNPLGADPQVHREESMNMKRTNPLAQPLVDALRTLRRLRQDEPAFREVLQVAIEVIAGFQRDLAQARRQNLQLRAELRAFMSGRTIAAERQELERQAVEGIAA